MPTMKDVQLYRRRSRKNLEKWCKKIGVPAGKSSSSMEESLSLHLQKQKVPRSNLRNSDLPLGLPEPSSANNHGKIMINHCFFQQGTFAYAGVDPTFAKRREGSKMNNLDGLRVFNNYSQAHESSQGFSISQCTDRNAHHNKASSSFEFYVASDDGIKLSVDLNYKPSDWIRKCNDEASVFAGNNFKRVQLESKKDGELLGPQNNTKDSYLEPRTPFGSPEKSALSIKAVYNGDKSFTLCSNGFVEHQGVNGNAFEKHLCEEANSLEKGELLEKGSSDFAKCLPI